MPDKAASLSSHLALASLTEPMTDHEHLTFRPIPPEALRCDASVPSFYDDEVRYVCLHEAEVEAMWTDGVWHPRCRRHVNGYPANRVRPLGGAE